MKQRAILASRPFGARFDLIARMLCYGTAFAYSVFVIIFVVQNNFSCNKSVMKRSYYRTDFLFSKSSFWIGAGSILSIFSSYFTFNYSDSSYEADRIAMESDFGVIGRDMKKAIESFKI